ncbi:hypothetical protein [Hyphomicrobium sp. ghe19]|uniref:baeRF8 domain-containing protein n=1 Tax=Hyphomicrobium sp. ghe19 TaxID=2682968 RepID=UPI00136788B1|nr:hypothetical protein HYPP_02679 [Hyphomicrobium sp. ghe19]
MQNVDIPDVSEFKGLAAVRNETCVSIYLPINPAREAGHANRLLLKDLVKDAVRQLQQVNLDEESFSHLSHHFEHLLGINKDPDIEEKVRLRQRYRKKFEEVSEFWKSQSRGLGILATPESMRTFRLSNAVKPLAEVADRFHIQPLVRTMTMPHEAYVLALTQNSARLLHIFANMQPEVVHVPKFPKSLPEGLLVYARAPSINLMLPEYEKVLMQEYVHKVDNALKSVLTGRDTPLILASEEPLASIFRSHSSSPHLLPDMISGNPDDKNDAQLSDDALAVLERSYMREIQKILGDYDELKPRFATTDVSYAAHCATYGAIDKLIIDIDANIPGIVDDDDGSVTYAVSDDAETYSVVDEIAKRAFIKGARVLGASNEELPDHAPLVAILRFRL